ncbi:MAG TPA: hypothetical protein VGJ60_15760 [Chloroflexota bacterium]|jgi:hypothetical protein
MALSDIPPFVPSAPDDLIRSEDINAVQRLVRDSARSHRHTRDANAPPDDATAQDLAPQLGTQEIVDLAVTGAKLAASAVTSTKLADLAVASAGRLTDNAVSTGRLQDAAVINQKLALNAVAHDNIQDGAISRQKLAMVQVDSSTTTLAPIGSTAAPSQILALLRSGLADTANILFWPQLTIVSTQGTTGTPQVESNIVYRRSPTSSGPAVVDVLLRLTNLGQAACTINWRVMTFVPFNPPYPFAFRAGIGGELV